MHSDNSWILLTCIHKQGLDRLVSFEHIRPTLIPMPAGAMLVEWLPNAVLVIGAGHTLLGGNEPAVQLVDTLASAKTMYHVMNS